MLQNRKMCSPIYYRDTLCENEAPLLETMSQRGIPKLEYASIKMAMWVRQAPGGFRLKCTTIN